MKQNDYLEELMKELHADKEMPTAAYRRELMKKLEKKGDKARTPIMLKAAIVCAACCLVLGIGIYSGKVHKPTGNLMTDRNQQKDTEKDIERDLNHNPKDSGQDDIINQQENPKTESTEIEAEQKTTVKKENESDNAPETPQKVPDTISIPPKSTPQSTPEVQEETKEIPVSTPAIPESSPEVSEDTAQPQSSPGMLDGVIIIPANTSEPFNTTSPLPLSPSEAPIVLADLPDEISLSLCNMTKFDISEGDFGNNDMLVRDLSSQYFTDQLITSYSQIEELIQNIKAVIKKAEGVSTGLEPIVIALERYDAAFFETKSLCIGNVWLSWGHSVELSAVGAGESTSDILEVKVKAIWNVPPDSMALCVMVNHICMVEIPTVKDMNCSGVEFSIRAT